jgi:hypothetical protein
MSEVYVIRNQSGHYWGKGKEWVDGSQPRAVMRLKHEDEALNTLFELGSKDFELRGEVLSVELTERGDPVLEVSQVPLPLAADEAFEATDEVSNAGGEASDPAEKSAGAGGT